MKELIRLTFNKGIFMYMDDFTVRLEGSLWPRELEAANQILQIFKAEHKEYTKPQTS